MFNFLKKRNKIIINISGELSKDIDNEKKSNSIMSQDFDVKFNNSINLPEYEKLSFQRSHDMDLYREEGITTDDSISLKAQSNGAQTANQLLLSWYARQGFIGWNACAYIFQHWLVKKACSMPAKDAIRNGYEITINDGTVVSQEIIDSIRNYDEKFSINRNMREFITKGRVFGIRIAWFKVKSKDPDYYKMPFNIDAVEPGSYEGISQIDPYWTIPQLDTEASGDPGSIHFYDPTWWRIGNQLIHRSHLVIFRNGDMPDILKPTYIYGGIPVPQEIYEKVYNAERSGNELPLLLMTKRTDVLKTDMAQAIANPQNIINALNQYTYLRDNYGTKVIGFEDEMSRLDTTLSDADQVTMSLYQLVAAAANVPVCKLLGTTPKGFNATGEFEEANYHEELKSMQTHDLTPLLDRHHLLLIKSNISPEFSIDTFHTTISWKPLDEMTAKELAEVNNLKANTGAVLVQSGAVTPDEERMRIIQEPDSCYSGIDNQEIEGEYQE